MSEPKTNMIQHEITQMGFQNPVFTTDTPMANIDVGYIDSHENESVADQITAKSVNVNLNGLDPADTDSDMAAIRRARFAARNHSTLVSQEVDILFCNRVFTIKTRTYVNFKKSLQMLKPVGVLVALLLVLIFLFQVDSFVQSGSPNPDENV